MPEAISQIEVEIKNPNGLHMRPAMQLVDAASRFSSDIKVSNGETSVDAKSIMQIAMLAATVGTKLTITAEGADAQQAIEVLKDLVENRLFDEQPKQTKNSSAG